MTSSSHALESGEILKQLHIITRHGSRDVLRKDGTDLSEGERDGLLTAFGQKQMFDLGVWMRETYNSTGLFTNYDPIAMRWQSSETERTITSANSLALGFFPSTTRDRNVQTLLPVTPANIPVYTFDADSDIFLRAYNKCPTFLDNLQQLYQSDEWQQQTSDYQTFLTQLADTTYFAPFQNNQGFVPLENVWNVYDAVEVARTECTEGEESSEACQAIADGLELKALFTDDEWNQVRQLAHYAELQKFGIQTAGKLVGVNLLLELLSRIKGDDLRLSVFSAHYPTILGLFSALEEPFFDNIVIPNYASAVMIEVTEQPDSNARFFRVVYKGDDQNPNNAVVVNLEHICGNPSVCPVDALEDYLVDWNTARWCRECNNDSAQACAVQRLEQVDAASSDDGGVWDRYPGIVGLIIGLSVGLVGVLVTIEFSRRKTAHQRQPGQVSPASYPSYPTNTDDAATAAQESLSSSPSAMDVEATEATPRAPPSVVSEASSDVRLVL